MEGLTKILVVDDKPQLLIDALPMYGFDTLVAYDGIEGYNILANNKDIIDLIILDINMPKKNGWKLLKEIRSDNSYEHIPILMLTGIQEEEKEVASLRFGADDYIVKPYRIPTLIAHIEALIRRAKVKKMSLPALNISTQQDTDTYSIKELSNREKELLKLVAEGKNNKDIADLLSIQEATVKSHLRKIFAKLNVTNRMQAAMLALKLDLFN